MFPRYGSATRSYLCAFNSVLLTIVFSDVLTDDQRAALSDLQHRIIGERDTRDATKTPFEDDPRAQTLKSGQRCFSLSLTVETPRQTGAPAASSKMEFEDDELDDHQQLRKDLVRVSENVSAMRNNTHLSTHRRPCPKLLRLAFAQKRLSTFSNAFVTTPPSSTCQPSGAQRTICTLHTSSTLRLPSTETQVCSVARLILTFYQPSAP